MLIDIETPIPSLVIVNLFNDLARVDDSPTNKHKVNKINDLHLKVLWNPYLTRFRPAARYFKVP